MNLPKMSKPENSSDFCCSPFLGENTLDMQITESVES